MLYTVPGWGKSSFGAYATKPIFLLTETGLLTLIQHKQVPEDTPYITFGDDRAEAKTWDEILDALRWFKANPGDRKTLCIDTANGVEKLLHKHVCDKSFGGSWVDFDTFAKGQDKICPPIWREFLNLLTDINHQGIQIILLTHVVTAKVKNPSGNDYDQFQSALTREVLHLTTAWVDATLFGTYEIEVITAKNANIATKGKVRGGHTRVIYTQHQAGRDAKNRYSLPAEILCESNAQDTYNQLASLIQGEK